MRSRSCPSSSPSHDAERTTNTDRRSATNGEPLDRIDDLRDRGELRYLEAFGQRSLIDHLEMVALPLDGVSKLGHRDIIVRSPDKLASMTEMFEFKDPKKRQPLTVKTVKKTDLEVISHQRKPRASHLKQLTASIERIGFVTPLVVVERNGKHIIIDGQHRFTAGSELGVKEFPVVVVPEKLARRMMSLNVEKDLNIRERCEIALSIYREVLESSPKTKEDDEEISDTIENAHYVTLGLAYEGPGRLAGGAFEPILKKFDGFLDKPLTEAYEKRKERAEKVLEAWKLVKAVEDALKTKKMWHSMVRYQIIAAADPAKRARKPQDFDKAFPKFIAKLEELVEAPEKVLRQKTESNGD